jgi:hypothetical protein
VIPNAQCPIFISDDPFSNSTTSRNLDSAKQNSPMFSTHRGIIIFLRDDDEKAEDSIIFNSESDSNLTSTSDSHEEKHDRASF